MNHADTRATLLRLAADDANVSSATIKRSLDLLAYLDIEELDVESVTADDWGALAFSFAVAELPQLVVHGYDITACASDDDHPVAKLINAVTCAYEADDIAADEGEDAEDE